LFIIILFFACSSPVILNFLFIFFFFILFCLYLKAWFLQFPAVTDRPVCTGMNNAFLLIFVLFLSETIIPDCLWVVEVRPDAERDDGGRENCQQREQRVARLPATV